MATLSRELRRELERTVKLARRVAEAGARKAIERLGVGDAKPPAGLSQAGQSLRDRLRAHGRQLGDRREARTGKQVTTRLVAECAYENWHRMLFARFLAENELLIEPEYGVPISLDDCKELARSQNDDWLTLASSYAVRMLPQIFRPNDPVLDVSLPPETRSELEDQLKGLPAEIFQADDSLGWVYQFWQAERKDEVNASETKIGADELPAVTQLFTEDYMVLFLLHNTLGAWWAGKVLAARPELATSAASEDELRAACAVGNVAWTYLRFVREGEGPWRPAAGTFDGWPKSAREITVLDPCMGSGHFLVFALPILVAMRMVEEGLARESAVDAVLRDNLFGLEIDPRCTQIAAFNLALAAWRILGGHRPLPALQLACSGLGPAATVEEWLALADDSGISSPRGGRETIRNGLLNLHELFSKSPLLGSLIDPTSIRSSLIAANYETVSPYLAAVFQAERSDEDTRERAIAAAGMVKAAELLAAKYTLVITNVPYLGFKRQSEELRSFCESHYTDSQSGLETTFFERSTRFLQSAGALTAVVNQTWLFQPTSRKLREKMLDRHEWNFVARLGARAFETITGDVVNVALVTLRHAAPSDKSRLSFFDAQTKRSAVEKAAELREAKISVLVQTDVRANPSSIVTDLPLSRGSLLAEVAISSSGLKTGDRDRFNRYLWEVVLPNPDWEYYQVASKAMESYSGCSEVILWEKGEGQLAAVAEEVRHLNNVAQNWRRGQVVWGRRGVAVSAVGKIESHLYEGSRFDSGVTVICPKDEKDLPAVWAFCKSPEFEAALRAVDSKISITTSTVLKVEFSDSWTTAAAEKFPSGLPEPESNDPTQWLFHGLPSDAQEKTVLQVAVARLLGYRWPAELDGEMRLSQRARKLVERGAEIASHADGDGIVCLPSIKGEAAAANRANALLATTFGSEWSAGKLDALLAGVGFAGKPLDLWLRDGFFENHCEVFHQHPFIWHIWDGRQDGFHALVNYHRIAAPNGEGRRTLEKLIYSYLGDWIVRQRGEQANGVDGADARLAAAEHLKSELEKILAGEPPYDIFVRWKPLHEQPIGWEPDINDGVRINIRPFMTARPLGARSRNASILRVAPRIKWDKDRGKEPDRPTEDYPWFWSWDERTQDFVGGSRFDGNRWNGLHYSIAAKRAARERAVAEVEAQETKA